MVLRGISPPFGGLSPCCGQVVQVILTLTPLYKENRSSPFSCDLHALTTPPTFVLSQDQTLQLRKSLNWTERLLRRSCHHHGRALSRPNASRRKRPGAAASRVRKALLDYLFTFQGSSWRRETRLRSPPAGACASGRLLPEKKAASW